MCQNLPMISKEVWNCNLLSCLYHTVSVSPVRSFCSFVLFCVGGGSVGLEAVNYPQVKLLTKGVVIIAAFNCTFFFFKNRQVPRDKGV